MLIELMISRHEYRNLRLESKTGGSLSVISIGFDIRAAKVEQDLRSESLSRYKKLDQVQIVL
jgi:hypothetical protein